MACKCSISELMLVEGSAGDSHTASCGVGSAGLVCSYEKQLAQRYTEAQRDAIQLGKPVYSAAALYAACRCVCVCVYVRACLCVGVCVYADSSCCSCPRLMKIRSDKAKFLSVAATSRAMFHTVLEEMQHCVPQNASNKHGLSQWKLPS